MLTNYSNRIGAWVTSNSFHNLVESLSKAGHGNKSIDLLYTLSMKGVKFRNESLVIVMQSAVVCGDKNIYLKTIDVINRTMGSEISSKLASEYPFIETKTEDTNNDDVVSTPSDTTTDIENSKV